MYLNAALLKMKNDILLSFLKIYFKAEYLSKRIKLIHLTYLRKYNSFKGL